MKTILNSALTLVLLLIAGATNAQSTAAVQSESGRFYLADKSYDASNYILTIQQAAASNALVVLQDGKVLPFEGNQVISFTFTIKHGDVLFSLDAKDNQLTSEMKDALKNMKSGSELFFENIKSQSVDGEIRALPSLEYRVD